MANDLLIVLGYGWLCAAGVALVLCVLNVALTHVMRKPSKRL